MTTLGKRGNRHKYHPKAHVKPADEEPKIASAISKKFQMSEDIIAGAPLLMGYGRGGRGRLGCFGRRHGLRRRDSDKDRADPYYWQKFSHCIFSG